MPGFGRKCQKRCLIRQKKSSSAAKNCGSFAAAADFPSLVLKVLKTGRIAPVFCQKTQDFDCHRLGGVSFQLKHLQDDHPPIFCMTRFPLSSIAIP
jgi:hypothetical protein